ncbi:MAG: DoxX family membrane protein [Vicinamibacteraceae bacterium]
MSDPSIANRPQSEQVGPSGIYPASGAFPKGDAVVRGQGELAHPEERRFRLLPAPSEGRLNATLLGAGRAVFGGFFLYNGINHFLNCGQLAAYARSKQVPMPRMAVLGSGALLLAGGLSLLTGVRPRIGASLIGTFLAGVSPHMHAFWNIADDEQRGPEMINFTKNMALLGGACLAASLPEPWPASLDRRGQSPR